MRIFSFRREFARTIPFIKGILTKLKKENRQSSKKQIWSGVKIIEAFCPTNFASQYRRSFFTPRFDGNMAVQTAKSERPDIILLDISLPVIDGIAATSQLKSNVDTQHIPIIDLADSRLSF